MDKELLQRALVALEGYPYDDRHFNAHCKPLIADISDALAVGDTPSPGEPDAVVSGNTITGAVELRCAGKSAMVEPCVSPGEPVAGWVLRTGHGNGYHDGEMPPFKEAVQVGWRPIYTRAIPPGFVLCPVTWLIDMRNRVNTLAALPIKSERVSHGIAMKRDIAEMMNSAPKVTT